MTESKAEIQRTLHWTEAQAACLEVLDEPAQSQLRSDLQAAIKAHEQEIHDSMHEAVNHLPRLLRRPFRKMLGL